MVQRECMRRMNGGSVDSASDLLCVPRPTAQAVRKTSRPWRRSTTMACGNRHTVSRTSSAETSTFHDNGIPLYTRRLVIHDNKRMPILLRLHLSTIASHVSRSDNDTPDTSWYTQKQCNNFKNKQPKIKTHTHRNNPKCGKDSNEIGLSFPHSKL